jgi:hypothetical protein
VHHLPAAGEKGQVELRQYKVKGSKPFVIAPLGDVQWNGSSDEVWCDGLKRHIDRALEANAIFLGFGDLIDYASPSSRQKLKASGAYQGPMKKLDDIGRELALEVYNKFLKPTKGRWAGLHEGHHMWEFQDGSTTDMMLAEMLGCPHLGTEAIVEWHWQGASFQTWSHHGWGAGEESALLNRLKKVAADWEDVQMYLMGHCTRTANTTIPKLHAVFDERGRGDLKERRIQLVGSGGWSKGKIVGSKEGLVPRGNYVEKGGMRPVSLGAPLVYVSKAPKGHVSQVELEVRQR